MTLKMHVETTNYTYVDLNSTVDFFRQCREHTDKGKFYPDLGIIVFSAFTMEAYLNHAGSQVLENWDELERSLNPKAKLKLVCEKLDVNVDLKSQEYQDFLLTFRIRDSLAHGKTTRIEQVFSEQKRAGLEEVYFGRTQVEELGEKGKLIGYSDSIRSLISAIHAKLDPGKKPFAISQTAEEWNS